MAFAFSGIGVLFIVVGFKVESLQLVFFFLEDFCHSSKWLHQLCVGKRCDTCSTGAISKGVLPQFLEEKTKQNTAMVFYYLLYQCLERPETSKLAPPEST